MSHQLSQAVVLWSLSGLCAPAFAGSPPSASEVHPDLSLATISGTVRTLSHGEVLRGDLVVENLFVPRDVTAYVAADTHITAERTIRIDGYLEFVPLEPVARIGDTWELDRIERDAPNLGLAAAEWIEIRGRLVGGRGANLAHLEDTALVGQRGGAGSTIYLESPLVWIDGQVRGGDGGEAAAGGVGGQGGSVLVHGRVLTHDADTNFPEILGGSGGAGGRGLSATGVERASWAAVAPGRGGAGGDAVSLFSDLLPVWQVLSEQAPVKHRVSEPFDSFGLLPQDQEPICQPGAAGAKGGDAKGGTGGTGGQGKHGTSTSPDGAQGAPGGKGGDGNASANKGADGKKGDTCCNPVRKGGMGGSGGDGGEGKGGEGGQGGLGGNGWFSDGAFVGAPGPGGPGGPGGDGKSGNGGTGGPGGDGVPSGDGGWKGKGPKGKEGPGGKGGYPGTGNGAGAHGDPGPDGGKADGTDGAKGPDGGGCKETKPEPDDDEEEESGGES